MVWVEVCGRFGPYEGPGGACSGYLVGAGDFRVLLDCGPGVLGQLGKLMDPADLDAVILSHLHPDHAAGLLVLRYALDTLRFFGRERGPLPVYTLEEPAEEFARLPYKEVFDLRPIRPGAEVTVGPFRARFAAGRHFVPSVATRLEAGGASLVYSGDTSYAAEVGELARGAGLFICEASMTEDGNPGHMSGTEAGRLAAEAGVQSLWVTHFHPRVDISRIVAGARDAYGGEVQAAVEGLRLTLEG